MKRFLKIGLAWGYASYSIHFIHLIDWINQRKFHFQQRIRPNTFFSWKYSTLFPKTINQSISIESIQMKKIFTIFNNLVWNSVKITCCVQCDSVKIIVPPFCSPSGGYCFPPSFVGVVPQATLGWWCLTLRLSGFLTSYALCLLSNEH